MFFFLSSSSLPHKFLFFILFLLLPSSSSASSLPPNFLFLLADDLGFSDFDWRDPLLHTPNLRQLAFSPHSVQLTNAYVGPLCTPSRAAMLSGLYPFRMGLQNVLMHADSGGLPPVVPLLPQLLRERGYRTHLIGKWHLGYCHRHFLPTARGFGTFYGYYGPQEGYYNHSADVFDHTYPGVLLRGLDLFRERGAISEPDWVHNGVYSTELFADEAIRVLSSHQLQHSSTSTSPPPFFLMLSFQAVHAPLERPPGPILGPLWQGTPSGQIHLLRLARDPRSNHRIQGILSAMDWAIGRLIDHLRKSGQYEHTVILFGTDNGGDPKFGASNAPLRGGKGTLWEGGTRSSVIVHSPAHITQFASRDDLFHTVDWPATLLGAIVPGDTQNGDPEYGDGINQWPMIIGGAGRRVIRRKELIYGMDPVAGLAAIRVRQFKLLLRPGHRPALFNLVTDPNEQRNLVYKMPKVARKLKRKLEMIGRKAVESATKLRTDPRGWPQKLGGVFRSGWC